MANGVERRPVAQRRRAELFGRTFEDVSLAVEGHAVDAFPFDVRRGRRVGIGGPHDERVQEPALGLARGERTSSLTLVVPSGGSFA